MTTEQWDKISALAKWIVWSEDPLKYKVRVGDTEVFSPEKLLLPQYKHIAIETANKILGDDRELRQQFFLELSPSSFRSNSVEVPLWNDTSVNEIFNASNETIYLALLTVMGE